MYLKKSFINVYFITSSAFASVEVDDNKENSFPLKNNLVKN